MRHAQPNSLPIGWAILLAVAVFVGGLLVTHPELDTFARIDLAMYDLVEAFTAIRGR
jgi:hypothetical protein